MSEGDGEEPQGSDWRKRPSWCLCGPPYREELEATVGLLIEGYISAQEARESLVETRWKLEFMQESMTALSIGGPNDVEFSESLERDLRIASKFIDRIEAMNPQGVASRSEQLRQILGQDRAGELDR